MRLWKHGNEQTASRLLKRFCISCSLLCLIHQMRVLPTTVCCTSSGVSIPLSPSEPTGLRVTAAQSNSGAWHSRVWSRDAGCLPGLSVDFVYSPCRCASLPLLLHLHSLGRFAFYTAFPLAFTPFHSFSHSFDIPLHCFDSSVPLLLLHSLHAN